MLAQNFLSADQLHITDDQQSALIKVLGALERGELHHMPVCDNYNFHQFVDYIKNPPVGFNMRYFSSAEECGTVCCLCGWAEHIGRLPLHSLADARTGNVELDMLFDPSGDGFEMENITTGQAATALRNYLTTGKSRWEEIIKITA